MRFTDDAWRIFIRAVLRYRTVDGIRLHVPVSRYRCLRALRLLREGMARDVPEILSGVVEVDETYIAGMWHNKSWSERKAGTKRGRGTSKQPVFGIRERGRGIVRAFLVPDVRKATILPRILATVERGSTIYSDAYQVYQALPNYGYRHAFVDHHQHEYGRGEVHSNGMEGFWGYLKRRLKITGGIRRTRLHLYVAEEVWRYNHRTLSEDQRITRLLEQIRTKIGG